MEYSHILVDLQYIFTQKIIPANYFIDPIPRGNLVAALARHPEGSGQQIMRKILAVAQNIKYI